MKTRSSEGCSLWPMLKRSVMSSCLVNTSDGVGKISADGLQKGLAEFYTKHIIYLVSLFSIAMLYF